MKKYLLVMVVGFVLSACSLASEKKTVEEKTMLTPTPSVKTEYEPQSVKLLATGGSGQNGVATIFQEELKTKVVIEMEKASKVAQPAHVHYGVCPETGIIKYALNDVVNGKSETLLDAPMSELVASGSMAINVHKSDEDISQYVSCGDIEIERW